MVVTNFKDSEKEMTNNPKTKDWRKVGKVSGDNQDRVVQDSRKHWNDNLIPLILMNLNIWTQDLREVDEINQRIIIIVFGDSF